MYVKERRIEEYELLEIPSIFSNGFLGFFILSGESVAVQIADKRIFKILRTVQNKYDNNRLRSNGVVSCLAIRH